MTDQSIPASCSGFGYPILIEAQRVPAARATTASCSRSGTLTWAPASDLHSLDDATGGANSPAPVFLSFKNDKLRREIVKAVCGVTDTVQFQLRHRLHVPIWHESG